jgi:hypothetical protein
MAGRRPTKTFADVSLDLTDIPVGKRFGRIFHRLYPDPLGFGKSPSRFSDPRRRPEEDRFGILYLGASLKVCFVEAILRDRRNGAVADYPIDETDLAARRYAEIEVISRLSLVDLTGDGCIRMGIPSDVIGASEQVASRWWSVAIHEHPAAPDGIVYPSRLNEERNLALYDRAVGKLSAVKSRPLMKAPSLARVLDDLKVALA